MTLNNTYLLLKKLELYSLETYEHSINVAKLAEAFAKYLGIDEKNIEILKIAALFHDIGKLAIPKSILNKPSKLSKEEYEVIKNHPRYGVNLLISSGFLNQDVLFLILTHHERLDGLGYPLGLKKDKISSLSYILSICDCYDAMYSKRVYKSANNIEFIKNEYLKNLDTQFDSKYTYLFLYFLENNFNQNIKNR